MSNSASDSTAAAATAPASTEAAAPATAPAPAAASAATTPAISPNYPARPAPAPWNNIQYLLHRYCHDDPKKLNDFRLPELDALCELVGAPVPCYSRSDMLYSSPFLPVRFPSEAHIRRMAERAILVKGWLELWGRGSTLEEALADVRSRRASEPHQRQWAEDASLSFDLRVVVFGHSFSEAESAQARTATLEALGLKGSYRPNQNAAGVSKFFLLVDVGSSTINPQRTVRGVYVGREIPGCGDRANSLEQDYRLNARKFIGPTSMPAGLSFIMSTLGQVKRGSVVFDPFVGTGSLLVSAGHFGALCIGADLDYKILHGKTRKGALSVLDNFKQYRLAPPEILCADLSVNAWKERGSQGFLDAIVCDPPYGVRAGARKLGRAEAKQQQREAAAGASADAGSDAGAEGASAAAPMSTTPSPSPSPALAPAVSPADSPSPSPSPSPAPSSSPPSPSSAPGRGVSAHNAHTVHIPATQLYSVEDVIHDLLDLAAQLLVLGGRLVYWLPTTTSFRNEELPAHPCLRRVSVGEQLVRSHFSRRLITMEKVVEFAVGGRMRRRDQATEPPPKYANLKEMIQTLSEEGPDKHSLEFAATGGAAAAGAAAASTDGTGDSSSPAAAGSGASPAPGVDLSVSFAPRPLSIRSQKRLAKAESIRQLRAQIIAEHGGHMPSRKQQAAEKGRMPVSEWEHMQREKNKHVQKERARQKREAAAAQAAAAAAEGSADQASNDGAPAAAAAAAAPATSTPAASAGSASSAPMSPTPASSADAAAPRSPDSSSAPPAKKARVATDAPPSLAAP